MKKVLIPLLVGAGIYGWITGHAEKSFPPERSGTVSRRHRPAAADTPRRIPSAERILAGAYRDHRSDLEVEGSAKVVRVLPDDRNGRRHQKFIVALSTGQTLLISHNIDLAPRIDGIRKGDRIEFRGEYEYNPSGGVIHWTHHDPRGRHENGWLKHRGRIYR